jgi:hypothetical protein
VAFLFGVTNVALIYMNDSLTKSGAHLLRKHKCAEQCVLPSDILWHFNAACVIVSKSPR